MENKLFKSSAFGGFNRQDVLEYIKSASRETTETLEKNRAEIERLQAQIKDDAQKHRLELDCQRTENMQMQSDLQVSNDALERLTSEKDALAARLEEKCRENARLSASVSQLDAQLDALSTEIDELRATLSKLEPDALSYQTMKLHMAEIEVSAYQRAEAIETAACERAEQTRAHLESLLSEIKAKYNAVQSGFEVTCSHISGELEKMQDSLNVLSAGFDGVGAEFDSIRLPETVSVSSEVLIPEQSQV